MERSAATDAPTSSKRRGVSPLALVAASAAVGVLLARVIDWRSHAHPRR